MALARVTAVERNEYMIVHGARPQNWADFVRFRAEGGHIFDESEIVGSIKKRLNDWSRGHFRADTTPDIPALRDSVVKMLDYLYENPRPIAQEHSDKGIAWWRARCFKADRMTWREDKFTENISAGKRDTIERFTHFEFIGYVDREVNNYGLCQYLPWYRVHSANNSFDYVYGSWQSGKAMSGLEFV